MFILAEYCVNHMLPFRPISLISPQLLGSCVLWLFPNVVYCSCFKPSVLRTSCPGAGGSPSGEGLSCDSIDQRWPGWPVEDQSVWLQCHVTCWDCWNYCRSLCCAFLCLWTIVFMWSMMCLMTWWKVIQVKSSVLGVASSLKRSRWDK